MPNSSQVPPDRKALYGEEYYSHYSGSLPYDRSRYLEFFDKIAEWIERDIAPRTVMDIGCAKGFLVEAMRDRGIEAYGVDISDYAISQVREDIKPYCRVGAATDPLDRDYDLVTCIELAEHLTEDEAKVAIRNMSARATRILFSSSPEHVDEPTHINEQPVIYWLRMFSEHGFFPDAGLDASQVVTPHTVVLKKGAPRPIEDVLPLYVALKERQQALLRREELVGQLRRSLAEINDSLAWQVAQGMRRALDRMLPPRSRGRIWWQLFVRGLKVIARKGLRAFLQKAFSRLNIPFLKLARRLPMIETNMLSAQTHKPLPLERDLYVRFVSALDGLEEIQVLTATYQRDCGSLIMRLRENVHGGRIAAEVVIPGSRILNDDYTSFRFPPLDDSGRKVFFVQLKSIGAPYPAVWFNSDITFPELELFDQSGKPTNGSINFLAFSKKAVSPYELWMKKNEPADGQIQGRTEMSQSLEGWPKISLVLPLAGNDPTAVEDTIRSLLAQSYGNWELCATGACDEGETGRLVKEYSARDTRIVIVESDALSTASGEYVGTVDSGDRLAPFALYEVARLLSEKTDAGIIYSDSDSITPSGRRFAPLFKPDWSPDYFLSYDYIGRLALFRKDLAVRVGGYRAEYAEAQDYDLLLRASENTRSIVHVPKVLYHRLADGRRRARGPYEAEKRAVEDALRRRMSEASVLEDNGTGVRRIRYKIAGTPKVAIIIPTRDNASILKVCIQSVIRRTRYENYEIVIVDNQSAEEETLQYYRRLESQHPNVRILHYDKPFNYSAINNFAVSRISADYVLFLNNDTEVIGGGWLTPMLELAQRDDVGVVGAKLCYRNNTIQHGGVILGVDGIAGHSHKRYSRSSRGYMERLVCVQNLSAVTGACMMIRKRLFEELGGFDEAIAISYNDVDLCLRVREKGLLVIFTPYAALYHHEGRSLGDETVERQTRLGIERALMLRKWRQTLGRGDPYYSPNLTHGSEDFGIRI